MISIDCSGFPRGHQVEETADVLPFNQVKATFPNQHPYTYKLQENLNSIFLEEDEDSEDMFIFLHNPTAAIQEIFGGVKREAVKLKKTK